MLLLAVWMSIAPCVQAQGFWQKKEYQTWSKSECQQLLKESPWANSYTIGTVIFETVQQQSAVPGRESAPQVTYRVQLWSARPIRQAIARMQQLDSKYGKLKPEKRQEFDGKLAKFIETEFPETVVVQVNYNTTQAYDGALARFWQSQSQAELRETIMLIGAGGRVAPLQVIVTPGAGREIQMIFPRQFQGKPLIGPDDKQLGLEFFNPSLGTLAGERVFIKFDVKKMMMDEKVVY